MTRFFTKEEVKKLVQGSIETMYGENRRWLRSNESIVKTDNKYYLLTWEEGLTECQENEFYDQDAPEVKQVEETVIIKKWVSV
jgi:hypothetical protein